MGGKQLVLCALQIKSQDSFLVNAEQEDTLLLLEVGAGDVHQDTGAHQKG